MIEELKNDEIVEKVGGQFKLAALIQRRWLQLLQGSRPLVESRGLTQMEIIVKEILDGKIEMELIEDEPEDDEES